MAERRSFDDDDDDRPRRRRDDEFDDEPRGRRRDDRDYDEDNYERPRRRRSQDEEDYDDEPHRAKRLPASKLRAIAIRQKVIIFCILGYLLAVVAQFVIPQDLRIVIAIPALIVALTATVFVFLLAVEVHGTGLGILFGILTLIPCVGLIILLIVNAQATSLLKQNRVRVGLMGANMSDIR
jgi:hypothetical protein